MARTLPSRPQERSGAQSLREFGARRQLINALRSFRPTDVVQTTNNRHEALSMHINSILVFPVRRPFRRKVTSHTLTEMAQNAVEQELFWIIATVACILILSMHNNCTRISHLEALA